MYGARLYIARNQLSCFVLNFLELSVFALFLRFRGTEICPDVCGSLMGPLCDVRVVFTAWVVFGVCFYFLVGVGTGPFFRFGQFSGVFGVIV